MTNTLDLFLTIKVRRNYLIADSLNEVNTLSFTEKPRIWYRG
jgi:hypothetical protein